MLEIRKKNLIFLVREKAMGRAIGAMKTQLREGIEKQVFPFGLQMPVPSLDRELLGGKGVGLLEMVSLGVPVPPGLIVTTEAFKAFKERGNRLSDSLKVGIYKKLLILEDQMAAGLGSPGSPLLLAIRSGARVCMPGMMDTILNVGLNDQTVLGFAKAMGNRHLAYDSYRRLIAMYGNVVEGIDSREFEAELNRVKKAKGVDQASKLAVEQLQELCIAFKGIYRHSCGKDFPQDTHEQLEEAVSAVFRSWENPRAVVFRERNKIPECWGTAVIIQAMVFGNRNQASGTGLSYSKPGPYSREGLSGEFLTACQGDEVRRRSLSRIPLREGAKGGQACLEKFLPDAFEQLKESIGLIEKHYSSRQEIEFTVDDGNLFLLETRSVSEH